MNRQSHPEVEEESEVVEPPWIPHALLLEIERGVDGLVASELVAVQQALYGDPIVGEEDFSFVPMLLVKTDLLNEPPHAVEDGSCIFEADDHVSDDRLRNITGFDVEPFSDYVPPDENGHVQHQSFVGFSDDFVGAVLFDELDLLGGFEVWWDVPGFTNQRGELDDGVVSGLPMDLLQADVGGLEDGSALYGLELPVVPYEQDGDIVAQEVLQSVHVDHGGFVHDDPFDSDRISCLAFCENRIVLLLPSNDPPQVVGQGIVQEPVNGSDVAWIVDTRGHQLTLEDIRGFPGKSTEGSDGSVS